MKLLQFAAALMGVASDQRIFTPERWFYVFAALFSAYCNALALLR